MSTRVDVEEIQTTKSEKLLAAVLALFLLIGGIWVYVKIDDAVRTVVSEFGRIASEPIEPDELEKARNFAKGRLVLSLEDPKGMIMFGLRNEVLEGELREPDDVLAGLDAVTIEDVQRVAQDIVREDRLNFALIGPFDDPDRFQKLLAFG